MDIKLFSYNVNGLRAAINKGFIEWLKVYDPDIICLQEIKVQPDQLDTSFLDELGYHHFWFPAEKKGYSGVAVFSKIKPDYVEYGMGHPLYDGEGRLLRTDYGDVTHLAVYFPSGTSGDLRQEVKMQFLNDFARYIAELRKERPNIIVSGDINIAHNGIDINHPNRHHKTSGFLPEERAWVDRFVSSGFIDSFRKFNQEPNQYSWWAYRAQAREKNLGWRIDYHFVTNTLDNRLKGAKIHQDIIHSDHCPVSIQITF